jgi:hypothetical protein
MDYLSLAAEAADLCWSIEARLSKIERLDTAIALADREEASSSSAARTSTPVRTGSVPPSALVQSPAGPMAAEVSSIASGEAAPSVILASEVEEPSVQVSEVVDDFCDFEDGKSINDAAALSKSRTSAPCPTTATLRYWTAPQSKRC